VGNALLVVHTTDARVERARFLHDQIAELSEQIQGDVVCLMVIPATADPPDTETRLEHARRFPKHMALRRFVTVAIGDEFWHKVVQGITHGLNQALGRGCLFVSAKTIPQGIEAMLDVHRGQANREQVARVTVALREVCKEMNVQIPK
jgi:hypothetical protein